MERDNKWYVKRSIIYVYISGNFDSNDRTYIRGVKL